MKPELLLRFEGKIVVFKGQEFIGPFGTQLEAYKAGLLKWGDADILVQEVTQAESIDETPSVVF